jgi:hypothetical protein
LTVVAGGKSVPLSALMGNAASLTSVNLPQAASAVFAGTASVVSDGKTTALGVMIGADGLPSVVIGGKTEALSAFTAEMTGDDPWIEDYAIECNDGKFEGHE